MDDIPSKDLLELSPDARRDESTDPVCGHNMTTDPPPPPLLLNDREGFDVETQIASFRRDILVSWRRR